jgi:glycosyltransferase involved in cell wall biosynthesis
MDAQTQDMKLPLVSIMMPVFNGRLFLPFALDSILAQQYANFELVVLDNLSTDGTGDICREYASRDARIRYVLDDRHRISHDAANHLATLIAGDYAMLACDDDLWEPTFLGRCVEYLMAHPDVGLVFPNAAYVDAEGVKSGSRLLSGRDVYNEGYDRFSNFKRFLRHRRVVPPVFGLFRAEVMRAALPFDTFDETIADVDNLFILKIMTLTKVHCIDEVLFFYRSKFRAFEPSLQNAIAAAPGWLDVWLYYAKHQWNFTRKILPVIDAAPFTDAQKTSLRLRTYWTLIVFVTVMHIRPIAGRLLARWGLRKTRTAKMDVHHDVRVKALKEMDYKKLVAAKQDAAPKRPD